MKQINARIIAFACIAVGLLLGAIALFSAYGESHGSALSCRAHQHRLDAEIQPHT